MRIYFKRKSFTLIELVVVLIILGVLAAISIPAYFSMIRRSQAIEALQVINSIKAQLVPCLRANKGDPNISCKCIFNVYPHDLSHGPGGFYTGGYTDCDANPPNTVVTTNIGSRTGWQTQNFEYWISNWKITGYDPSGNSHILDQGDPQNWNIVANHIPVDGAPGHLGSIQISGRADDSVPASCSSWGDLLGAC